MCGIIGYTGKEQALDRLLAGMENLAYRGYDSNGLVVQNGQNMQWEKLPGTLEKLMEALDGHSMEGTSGLGHTRWATHGPPNQTNAHPHFSCNHDIAVVHNGIIENHSTLRKELEKEGHTFRSETDTEVIPHLVETYYARTGDPLKSLRNALNRITGSFAVGVLFRDYPGELFGSAVESPLLVGLGEHENYLASDIPALLQFTRNVLYLEDREIVRLQPSQTTLFDPEGNEISRETDHIDWDVESAEKEGFDHFMKKEICSQPDVIRDTIRDRIDREACDLSFSFDHFSERDLRDFDRVEIVACGTSYHSGLIASYYLEQMGQISTDVTLGSEFRYAAPPLRENTLFLGISQSGETADTLGALDLAKEHGAPTFGVCNVMGSSLAREVDEVLYTRAGPEIGVAATKTYTTQIVTLLLVALQFHRARADRNPASDRHFSRTSLIRDLLMLPEAVEEALETENAVQDIARSYQDVYNFMFMGRSVNYPTALEGALKLKEISYINAEGYAGGEMKHGPLALIEDTVPTIALAPDDDLYEKMLSNIQEIHARDGTLIGLVDQQDERASALCDHVIRLPSVHPSLSPVVYTIPLQLLSYHLGLYLDRNVDQPRNLAKSVTVE